MKHKILTLTSILLIATFTSQQPGWAWPDYTCEVFDGLRPVATGERDDAQAGGDRGRKRDADETSGKKPQGRGKAQLLTAPPFETFSKDGFDPSDSWWVERQDVRTLRQGGIHAFSRDPGASVKKPLSLRGGSRGHDHLERLIGLESLRENTTQVWLYQGIVLSAKGGQMYVLSVGHAVRLGRRVDGYLSGIRLNGKVIALKFDRKGRDISLIKFLGVPSYVYFESLSIGYPPCGEGVTADINFVGYREMGNHDISRVWLHRQRISVPVKVWAYKGDSVNTVEIDLEGINQDVLCGAFVFHNGKLVGMINSKGKRKDSFFYASTGNAILGFLRNTEYRKYLSDIDPSGSVGAAKLAEDAQDWDWPGAKGSPTVRLMRLASEMTGARLLYPDVKSPYKIKRWFGARIREITGKNPRGYLMTICDKEGHLKEESREDAEIVFNTILLSFPAEVLHRSEIATSLNRHRAQYTYLEEQILPLLIPKKLREGRRILRLKVIGCSTGEEMASLYYYVRRAFSNHSEWGRLDEWELEISGIDIFAYAIEEAKRRLLISPQDLRWFLPNSRAIISSIQEISQDLRPKIFKIRHGNVVHSAVRKEFMQEADAVFINLVLSHILSGPRESLINKILDRDIWLCTNDPQVYEQTPKDRTAIELKGDDGTRRYIIAPIGIVRSQPELPPFSIPNTKEYEAVAVEFFDDPGAFLETNPFYGSYYFVRPDYDRAKHVAALIQTLKEGRLRLPPSVIQGLRFIAADPNLPKGYAECRGFAKDILGVIEMGAEKGVIPEDGILQNAIQEELLSSI